MNPSRAAIHLVLATVIVFSHGACAIEPAKLNGWIAYFKAHDPVVDATKNFQGGTIYVIGAMGLGAYYPGIDQSLGEKIGKAHAEKWLPGTSDAIESELHGKYINIGTDYAAKYNQTTVKLLGGGGKP